MASEASEKVTVGYVTTVRMTGRGQVPVPKELRQRLCLSPGSPVAIIEWGNGLLLLPEQPDFEALCERIRQTLAKTGRSQEEILATLPEARRQVFEELYGRAEEYESS